jgi:predicted DNA binding CopG/RHH family protein
MKDQLIQFRISEQMKKALEEKASKEGMTYSEAIRYLIQKWLES